MRSENLGRSLQRAGFSLTARAEKFLEDDALASLDSERIIWLLSESGDPDQGLVGLIRLLETLTREQHSQLFEPVWADDAAARRLTAVLGYSTALTDFVITHPQTLEYLVPRHWQDNEIPTVAMTALPADADEAHARASMRADYWTQIFLIAAYDLTAPSPTSTMDQAAQAITTAVSTALERSLAIAQDLVEGGHDVGFTVIAMGKTGGNELNYISDVDVVYVIDPRELPEQDAIRIGTKVGEQLRSLVSSAGGVLPLWELDTNLRPEGKDGPLVRTLDSYATYYQRWAENWEFQALLKARPIAGDEKLGAAFIDKLWPHVWSAASREGFVEGSREMRSRVERLIPAKDAPRALKLGKGGLRDVEFTVQLLQLVHGRTDEAVRVRSTLAAIAALSEGGYISRAHATKLESHYRFLRTFEHRIQLQRFKRSHLVPNAQADLARIARSLRGDGIDGVEGLERAWRRVQRDVREMHLEIYYRPLLGIAAKLDTDTIVLEPKAAMARLEAVGFKNPKAALAHITSMTHGVSRTAAIAKHIMPVMIGWLAEGPEPDNGLAAFRTVSEKLGNTSWYMRLLRDSRVVAQRLAHVLSTSRLIAQMLPDLSEAISWLDDDSLLQPRPAEDLRRELDAMISRRSTPESVALAGRYLRRRELLRLAMGQTLRLVDDDAVRSAISSAADVVVDASLRAAILELGENAAANHCVIAMGRLGANELGYASDADIMFVYEPVPGHEAQAAEEGVAVARRTMHFMTFMDREPSLAADAGLRPEGKNGALNRSLESYREYYERWVETWEVQALLRARVCAGDQSLGECFIELIDPIRYIDGGATAGQVRKIRTMKARVESERIPRGVDPARHLKLGRGSLSDVEWTVQLLQLRNAGNTPELRTTQTLPALLAAKDAGLVDAADADRLIEAWQLASAMRNWNALATGRMTGSKIDVLTHDEAELSIIAALAGVDGRRRRQIEDRYFGVTRRARSVVNTLFYGE